MLRHFPSPNAHPEGFPPTLNEFRARLPKCIFALTASLAWPFCGFARASVCPASSSHIVMESGSYSSEPGVEFVLHHFVATLVPMGKTAPTCLQKMTDVAHATIFVSNESLTQVFAKKLSESDSKIRDFKIVHGEGKVSLTGEIVKLVPIKFSIEGPVSTDGTRLMINASKIDADGIPIKMLLGLVGEHLSSVLGLKGVDGVSVEGNTMSFLPEKIAHLKGYIASVEASPAGLTLHYGHRRGRAVAHVGRTGRATGSAS